MLHAGRHDRALVTGLSFGAARTARATSRPGVWDVSANAPTIAPLKIVCGRPSIVSSGASTASSLTRPTGAPLRLSTGVVRRMPGSRSSSAGGAVPPSPSVTTGVSARGAAGTSSGHSSVTRLIGRRGLRAIVTVSSSMSSSLARVARPSTVASVSGASAASPQGPSSAGRAPRMSAAIP